MVASSFILKNVLLLTHIKINIFKVFRRVKLSRLSQCWQVFLLVSLKGCFYHLLVFFLLLLTVIPSQASPAQPDTKASLWSITTLRRLGSDSSTAIFAVLFLASLLVLAIVVIYFTRKRKMEDSKLLISAAWDE